MDQNDQLERKKEDGQRRREEILVSASLLSCFLRNKITLECKIPKSKNTCRNHDYIFKEWYLYTKFNIVPYMHEDILRSR